VPFYQPIVRIDTGEIVGVEALARMRTESGEIVAAGAFQEAFSNHRVAHALTGQMLSAIAADLRIWLDTGFPFQHVGINVSTADFRNGDLHQRITESFGAHGIPLSHVILEVTETVFMDGSDNKVARAVEMLRREGLKVALDDFGTGHASLTHLVSVPTDIVKIDRSFVTRMFDDVASQAIVETMIGLAARLGIRVVAEGVETKVEADYLMQLGCKLCQGYYFGRPADAATTLARLKQNGQRPSGERAA
jgi:EAL domain-containing protein (putative c-di-GMP-specific phosphodiesterase class I)